MDQKDLSSGDSLPVKPLGGGGENHSDSSSVGNVAYPLEMTLWGSL